jgi:inner membrane protein
MTWLSHTAIGVITGEILGLNPILTGLGATAPDWFEDFLGIKEHRGITHYVIIWFPALIIISIIYLIKPEEIIKYILSFVYGGVSHIILDSLTITGVPLGIRDIRIRIGGIIKTGGVSEYIFLVAVILPLLPFVLGGISIGINDAKGLYEKGIIDKKEYNEMKFKIFN